MLHRRSILPAALLAGVLVAGLAFTGGAPVVDPIPRSLARRLPELMEAAEILGLSAAYVRDGEVVWSGSYGVRDAESGVPVDGETVFEAASLSKPVFAYAVMRMVQRGLLDLDAPLAAIQPHPRLEHEPRYRRITARMVLSHSSGLPNWGGDRLALRFDPGTAFGYSGEGYVYLQRVVEKITGVPLEEVLHREVFEPLEMERSSFVWEPRFEENAAAGHDALGRPGELRRREEANAAASLLTTATDYGRFVAAVLEGRGLSPETRRRMFEPELPAEVSHASEEENARISWALGWGVQRADPRSIWHWGDNGDHKAFVTGFPEKGTAVVYFTNSAHGLSIAEAVAEIVGGGRHWGPAWAGYERHDDPTRLARRDLLHVFRDSGEEAGLARLEEIRAETPDLFDPEMAADLASLLHQAELDASAVSVLEVAVATFPESASAREELAAAHLAAERFEAARRELAELAETAEGEAAAGYRGQVAWVDQRLKALRAPARLRSERLRAYAGDYGPRRVVFEDGALFYQREGNSRYRLEPLDRTTFRLDGLETFRLRFVIDGDGRATKVVGLYFDGRRDESERDGT